MGQTIEDMDKEIELKDKTKNFSISKIKISPEENMKQKEKVNLTKNLDRTDGVLEKVRKGSERTQTII